MRTIVNTASGETLDTFKIFKDEEERTEYFDRETLKIRRAHRAKLDELRAAYMTGIHTDPDRSYTVYMTDISNQFKSYYRAIGLLQQEKTDSILEPAS